MITLEEFKNQTVINPNLEKMSTDQLMQLVKQMELANQQKKELDNKWKWGNR